MNQKIPSGSHLSFAKSSFFLYLAILLISSLPSVFALEELSNYVNDEANVISQDYELLLSEELALLHENTSVEMAIATVNSLNGVPIETYSLNLAHEVLGDEKKDNGLLILLAVEDREYRIEVGYGLEGIINAPLAGRIGREAMAPYFKEGNYEEGLLQGTYIISSILRNDSSWETAASEITLSDSVELNTNVVFLVFIVIFFIIVIASGFSQGKKTAGSGRINGGFNGNHNDDFDAAAIAAILFGRGGGNSGFGGSGGFGGFGGGGFGGGGFSGKF